MMTAEQLKGSILQLAMQGKLVEQRVGEGTGEELYKEIQTEKKRLLKEGALKKQKPLPEIMEEEKPFDIPESWIWVKLGDISSYAQPKEKVSPKDITPEMWSLDLEDIEKGTGKVLNHVLAKERKIQGDKVRFKKGNILYSKLRPYLLKILIADNEGITTPELVPFNIYGIKNSNFFLWYLRSPYVDNAVNSVSYGVKMPRVGTDTMVNLLVPLPPLAEQKRIVAKIEELMPFVEQYAAANTKLNTLNTNFPEMMKKSILQEAVQGKLVPQDPNDEPASVLLEKIAEEKKRLVKEGKIKKDKKESIISRGKDGLFYETVGKKTTCIQEQIPYDIPESWEWVRLRSYGQFSSGKTPSMSEPKNWIGDIPWISPKDMKTTIINDSLMHISQEACNEMTLYPAGTLLMVVRSGILKRKLPLCILAVDSTINQDIKAFSFYYNELSEWVYYELMGFEHFILHNLVKNVTTVDSLKFDEFQNLLVPLPPRSEQIRIIEKVKELIQSINGLAEL